MLYNNIYARHDMKFAVYIVHVVGAINVDSFGLF